jgi:hypothetical protein
MQENASPEPEVEADNVAPDEPESDLREIVLETLKNLVTDVEFNLAVQASKELVLPQQDLRSALLIMHALNVALQPSQHRDEAEVRSKWLATCAKEARKFLHLSWTGTKDTLRSAFVFDRKFVLILLASVAEADITEALHKAEAGDQTGARVSARAAMTIALSNIEEDPFFIVPLLEPPVQTPGNASKVTLPTDFAARKDQAIHAAMQVILDSERGAKPVAVTRQAITTLLKELGMDVKNPYATAPRDSNHEPPNAFAVSETDPSSLSE